MSKFKGTSTEYLTVATRSLSQQNFPDVYTYASAALAMGLVQSTLYLCAYYRYQIEDQTKINGQDIIDKVANFSIMYQLSENFQIKGYTAFTNFYTTLYNSFQAPVKGGIISAVAGYKKYLEAVIPKYPEEKEMTIEAAQTLVGMMDRFVAKYVEHRTEKPQESTHLLKDVSGDHYGNGSSSSHHQDEVPVAGKQSFFSKLFCCFGGNGEE